MGPILQCSSLAFLCAAAPALASADQGVAAGAAPFEVGVGVGSSSESPALAPIAVLNFGLRDALEFTAALSLAERGRFREDLYSVQYRRTVYRAGRGGIALTAGASFLKTEWHEQSQYRGVVVRIDQRSSSPAVTAGVIASLDLTRRLTFRVGYQLHLGPESSNRIAASLMIPIGARPALARTRLAGGPTALIARTDSLARLRAGQKVWVTTTAGREISADVGFVSPDSLDLVQRQSVVQLGRSEIARIETADGIRDGLARGLLIGAGAGFGLTLLACSSGCYEYTGLYLMMSTLMGAGTGALIGTLGDSLIEHRRVVYDISRAARLRITPALSPNAAGVRATLQW